jgi:protein-S-isoprenylcysteine O-methyltransferase Ste14
MTRATDRRRQPVGAWNHVRAIALLPFMNTIVIPLLIVAAQGPAARNAPIDAAFVARAAAALVLVLAGATLVLHCIRLFVRCGRGTLAPWDPTQTLVTQGAYRFSRNPMKGGLFLILLGEAVLLWSAPLLIWLTTFALANVVYIRWHEEPGLDARFGASYRKYCARVPRWLPGPLAISWHRNPS